MHTDQRPGIPRLLEGGVMKKSISIALGLLMCAGAFAEMKAWTLKNGQVFEGEFVAFSGGQVSLKNLKGKIKKIPESQFIEEDRQYIELINPPKLDISYGKTSNQRMYPPNYNNDELPRTIHYTFNVRIKQTSSRIYNHELNVELFVIGKENAGDKHVLYCYQQEPFYLEKGTKSHYELETEEVIFTEYVSYGQLRGEAYDGYMIIVTDSRGEIVASKATKEKWFGIADNLRMLPVGKTFDEKDGIRCFPSRPGRFY
jgi:hypothetical protein